MTFSKSRMRIFVVALASAAMCGAPRSHAILIPWAGANNANWTVAGGWPISATGTPAFAFDEAASISNATTVVVNTNLTTDVTAPGGIVVGQAAGNTGGIIINSGGNLATGVQAFNTETGAARIGEAGTGTVTVNQGGRFAPLSLIIGNVAGGVGTVTVNNGATVAVTNSLQVGQLGRGTLVVNGGGTVTAGRLNSGGATGATASMIQLGDTSGLTAAVTMTGPTSLLRTTQVTGPNVNFTTNGLTLPSTHTLIADIRDAANHSALKSTSSASVDGILKPQFTGVTPALGNSWNLVDATSISGNFSSIDASAAPALGAGQAYQTRKTAGGNGQLLKLVVEQLLTLQVNRQTGAMSIRNTGSGAPANVALDGYTITSTNGGLKGANANWNSLTDQAVAGWTEAPTTTTSLSELNTAGTLSLAGGVSRALGSPYSPVFTAFQAESDDVGFSYTTADGVRKGLVEYTGTKVANNLVISVNPTTGATTLKNDSPFNVSIEGYSVLSSSGALRPANGQWNSLTDQGTPNWTEAAPTANALSELTTSGSLSLPANTTKNLGTLFNPAGTKDLSFEFLLLGGADAVAGVVQYATPGGGFTADFNHDGSVNAADLGVWRTSFGAGAGADADGDGDSDGSDFAIWQRQLGSGPATAAAAAVPEPAAWLLSALAGVLFFRPRRKNDEIETQTIHQRSGDMMKMGSTRKAPRTLFAACVAACLALIGAASAQAADILLVGAQLDSSDRELVQLLKGFGHTVVNEGSYQTAAGQFLNGVPTPAQLTGVDLILFSRAAVSTEYDDGTEPHDWNSLSLPMIMMNSAFVRGGQATLGNNRWGWMNATDVPSGAIAPTDFDPYPTPTHPFVNGRTTSVFPPGQTIDYINSMDVPAGTTMVATLSVAGIQTPGILDMPAGTTLFTDAQGTVTNLGGRRVFFQLYEYPDTTDVFAVSTNGGQIINQIINTLAPQASSRAGDVDGDGDVDMTDFNMIKANFRTSVASRTMGDLTGDGFVDLADFRQWKDNDPLAGAGAGAAIPEPAALVLAACGLLGTMAIRRRG